MGQCVSSTLQLPLYCQIPRDLACSIHFVCQGYSELLDIDDIRVTQRRIRIIRKILDQSAASFETLSISFCIFKDAKAQQDLASLIQSRQGLKSLTFSHNELLGDANLTFLMESLKGREMDEIELNDRSIYGTTGEAFLKDLIKNVSTKRLRLKYMSLDTPAVRGLCRALRSPSCSLAELTLRECWVDDGMLSMIVDCLCKCPHSTVKKLDLESNSFSPLSLASLTRLVRENKSLEHLVLDRNEHFFFGADQAAAADFASAVASNTTLKILSLTLTDLGDVVAIPFFKALETNKTLVNLDIEDTFVSVEGYRQFVASLPRMRGLREVSVGWDDLFEEFPESLKLKALDALKRNESITSWYEVAMSYSDEFRLLLPFYFARNRQMIKARKVLDVKEKEGDTALWKVAVAQMARHKPSSSAVFEILRHRLPTHPLLPVTPLPKKKPVNEMWETVSWTDSSTEEYLIARILDQEYIMGPDSQVAIAYPVH